MRTGKIMLAKNINIDKDYKNVVDYTTEQMLTLINQNLVASAEDYSFIRVGENRIKVGFNYGTCLQANYIAMQNPNYSGKWFFAFIDSVEYLSDNSSIINYTVDDFSTWFDDWKPKTCFVIREHVNIDTIGLHTFPEGLETGDFIINDMQPIAYQPLNTDIFIVMGLTNPIEGIQDNQSRIYAGVYSGLHYIAFSQASEATKFIKGITEKGQADFIYSIFLLPKRVLNTTEQYTIEIGSQTVELWNIPDTMNAVSIFEFGSAVNHTLNSYIPKNNKLYCYPYNYMMITNNAGAQAIYKYEDFINNIPRFKIVGSICPGGSIKLIPQNYKLYSSEDYVNSEAVYGLNCGKYPTCSWNTDTYINWLTQNSINIGINTAISSANIAFGATRLAFGDVSGVSNLASGATSIGQSLLQNYQFEFVPNHAKGNINSGDIQYSGHMMSFDFFRMSIRNEYARMIDNYFTRFGYKVNELKTPNQTGRTIWNYVQISNDDDIGVSSSNTVSIPASSREIINNIYRRGVTIWHNHANIGNYNLDNSIQ